VTRLTRHEQWILTLLLLLIGVGLGGKVWLSTHPPASLAPLPVSAENR
jgi:hypothetical protein